MKTGIPAAMLRNSEDPFATLSDLIRNHDAVSARMQERYRFANFTIMAAPEPVFGVESISWVIRPKPKTPFAKLPEYLELGLGVAGRYPVLVHANKDASVLYVSGQIDCLPFGEFRVPYVVVPGKSENYFFANAQNFLDNLQECLKYA